MEENIMTFVEQEDETLDPELNPQVKKMLNYLQLHRTPGKSIQTNNKQQEDLIKEESITAPVRENLNQGNTFCPLVASTPFSIQKPQLNNVVSNTSKSKITNLEINDQEELLITLNKNNNEPSNIPIALPSPTPCDNETFVANVTSYIAQSEISNLEINETENEECVDNVAQNGLQEEQLITLNENNDEPSNTPISLPPQTPGDNETIATIVISDIAQSETSNSKIKKETENEECVDNVAQNSLQEEQLITLNENNNEPSNTPISLPPQTPGDNETIATIVISDIAQSETSNSKIKKETENVECVDIVDDLQEELSNVPVLWPPQLCDDEEIVKNNNNPTLFFQTLKNNKVRTELFKDKSRMRNRKPDIKCDPIKASYFECVKSKLKCTFKKKTRRETKRSLYTKGQSGESSIENSDEEKGNNKLQIRKSTINTNINSKNTPKNRKNNNDSVSTLSCKNMKSCAVKLCRIKPSTKPSTSKKEILNIKNKSEKTENQNLRKSKRSKRAPRAYWEVDNVPVQNCYLWKKYNFLVNGISSEDFEDLKKSKYNTKNANNKKNRKEKTTTKKVSNEIVHEINTASENFKNLKRRKHHANNTKNNGTGKENTKNSKEKCQEETEKNEKPRGKHKTEELSNQKQSYTQIEEEVFDRLRDEENNSEIAYEIDIASEDFKNLRSRKYHTKNTKNNATGKENTKISREKRQEETEKNVKPKEKSSTERLSRRKRSYKQTEGDVFDRLCNEENSSEIVHIIDIASEEKVDKNEPKEKNRSERLSRRKRSYKQIEGDVFDRLRDKENNNSEIVHVIDIASEEKVDINEPREKSKSERLSRRKRPYKQIEGYVFDRLRDKENNSEIVHVIDITSEGKVDKNEPREKSRTERLSRRKRSYKQIEGDVFDRLRNEEDNSEILHVIDIASEEKVDKNEPKEKNRSERLSRRKRSYKQIEGDVFDRLRDKENNNSEIVHVIDIASEEKVDKNEPREKSRTEKLSKQKRSYKQIEKEVFERLYEEEKKWKEEKKYCIKYNVDSKFDTHKENKDYNLNQIITLSQNKEENPKRVRREINQTFSVDENVEEIANKNCNLNQTFTFSIQNNKKNYRDTKSEINETFDIHDCNNVEENSGRIISNSIRNNNKLTALDSKLNSDSNWFRDFINSASRIPEFLIIRDTLVSLNVNFDILSTTRYNKISDVYVYSINVNTEFLRIPSYKIKPRAKLTRNMYFYVVYGEVNLSVSTTIKIYEKNILMSIGDLEMLEKGKLYQIENHSKTDAIILTIAS